MIRYAKAEFSLSRIEKDNKGNEIGVKRELLKQIEISTGRWVEELHPEPPPESLLHIWIWFMELHSTRGAGFGADPISYREIKAWMELMGARPSSWEVGVIKRLDMAYLESGEKGKKNG